MSTHKSTLSKSRLDCLEVYRTVRPIEQYMEFFPTLSPKSITLYLALDASLAVIRDIEKPISIMES